MIDLDAADCKVNETRRLSRYLLEHIFTLPKKNTPLLLLVRVGDDTKQFSRNTNKSSIINDAQQLPMRIIAGKEYFQFRCKLDDIGENEAVVAGNGYTLKRFKQDVNGGIGGFKVNFGSCDACHHFTWRQILNFPSSFMFFGAPLTHCRSFDNIFKDLNTFESIHQRFILYYDHVEGDVEATLTLFNSYLARKCAVAETKLNKVVTTSKKKYYDTNLFTSEKVVAFCNRFDKACMDAIDSVLTEFHNH